MDFEEEEYKWINIGMYSASDKIVDIIVYCHHISSLIVGEWLVPM
jgi:hypothetical protein